MPTVNTDKQYHREVTIDQHLPRWWDKWVNPTTVVAILGGVIWGIQLNFAVVNHTAEIAKLETTYELVEITNDEQNTQLTRIAVILDNLVDRMDKDENKVKTHNEDSEQWKRVIELNKQRIDSIERRLGGQPQ